MNRLIFCILFCVLSVVVGYNGIYILQVNGYKIMFLFKYLLTWWRRYLFLFVLLIFSSILLSVKSFDSNIYLDILVVMFQALLLAFVSLRDINKRKLVITKRVVRMLVTYSILVLSTCVLLLFCYCYYLLYLFYLTVIFDIVLLSISFIILIPIENRIARFYINSAKQKLNSNRSLLKIGITGSYGKTSVKEILTSILKTQYLVLSTPNSYNTPMGIVKTINNGLKPLDEIFVCELGAKKSGEISELCELIDVDMGVVTTVGRQHTDTFGGIVGVYNTKKELPDYLDGNLCVFNFMNEFTRRMYNEYDGKKSCVFYYANRNLTRVGSKIVKIGDYKIGTSEYEKLYPFPRYNNYYAKNVKCTEDGCVFQIYYDCKFMCEITSNLLGYHNVINILLAIALAHKVGVTCENLKNGVAKLKSINARLEKYKTANGAIVINNGYNSNIDSAKSALSVLELFDKKNKVVVTPGFIETEDDYLYNYNFGKILSGVSTEVVIVKLKNRQALFDGLIEGGYSIDNIKFANNFESARKVIEGYGSDSVVLIENDLPDNYE